MDVKLKYCSLMIVRLPCLHSMAWRGLEVHDENKLCDRFIESSEFSLTGPLKDTRFTNIFSDLPFERSTNRKTLFLIFLQLFGFTFEGINVTVINIFLPVCKIGSPPYLWKQH